MHRKSYALAILVVTVIITSSISLIILFIYMLSLQPLKLESSIMSIIIPLFLGIYFLLISIIVIYRIIRDRIRDRIIEKTNDIIFYKENNEIRYQATILFLLICFLTITALPLIILGILTEWSAGHIDWFISIELILFAILGIWKRKPISKFITNIYNSIP